MATAQYRCPKCKQLTGMRRIYCAGYYPHHCSKCGSFNGLTIKGYQVFTPKVETAVALKE